jgi:hypothetical protein
MARLAQYDPDGVAPPEFVAAAVAADIKRAKAGETRFYPDRQPIVLPTAEATKRAALFAQARKGNRAAIQALADEYHVRLIPVNAVSN